MKKNNLNEKEELILSVLSRKKRGMTPKEIAEELNKSGIKISRPTVSKYLLSLKKKGYIEEI